MLLRTYTTARATAFIIKPISDRGSYFKWRNHELYRIEAFSDAVFAFAVTLVVVLLEVPVTFHELIQSMYGMINFAICFLFLIWHQQYLFFRHFGLRDITCMALNALLLFIVLFYVYPLKFHFTLIYCRQPCNRAWRKNRPDCKLL